MGKRIQLKLRQDQASALLDVLNKANKELLRDIAGAGYSREFREFLREHYEKVEEVRSALEDACEQTETTFVVSTAGEDRAGHQAM